MAVKADQVGVAEAGAFDGTVIVEGGIGFDRTNKGLRLGDGQTPGGVPIMSGTGSNATIPAAARFRDGVSPSDYMGPTASIADRMQWAIDRAIDMQQPLKLGVPIENGAWLIDKKLSLSKPNTAAPNGEYVRVPKVDGGNANIVYVGTAMLPTLVEMLNASNAAVDGIRINGQGKVRTGFDASYLLGGAPSLGNSWRRIAIENVVPTSTDAGAKFASNNDCDLHDILIAASNPNDTLARALQINAPGGAIRMNQVRANGGETVFGAQCCHMIDCQASGIRAIGDDDNALFITGGYMYASATGVNIRIAQGKQIVALVVAARFENGFNGGRIIAADTTGYLNGGIDFSGQLLAPDGASHGVKLLDDSVMSRNPPAIGRVRGMIEYVDVSSNAGVTIKSSVWNRPAGTRIEN